MAMKISSRSLKKECGAILENMKVEKLSIISIVLMIFQIFSLSDLIFMYIFSKYLPSMFEHQTVFI